MAATGSPTRPTTPCSRPELTARSLPIGNRSVLKIQGTQALLDWLALKLAATDVGADPRDILTAPRARPDTEPRARPGTIAGLLSPRCSSRNCRTISPGICNGPCGSRRRGTGPAVGTSPVAAAVGGSDRHCAALTASGSRVRQDPGARPGDLLPEFITRALFDPLNVPEVWFDLPFSTDQDESLPDRTGAARGRPRPGQPPVRLPAPEPPDLAPAAPRGRGGAPRPRVHHPPVHPGGNLDPGRPGKSGLSAGHPPARRCVSHPRPEEVTDQSQGFPVWGTQIIPPAAGLTRPTFRTPQRGPVRRPRSGSRPTRLEIR